MRPTAKQAAKMRIADPAGRLAGRCQTCPEAWRDPTPRASILPPRAGTPAILSCAGILLPPASTAEIRHRPHDMLAACVPFFTMRQTRTPSDGNTHRPGEARPYSQKDKNEQKVALPGHSCRTAERRRARVLRYAGRRGWPGLWGHRKLPNPGGCRHRCPE